MSTAIYWLSKDFRIEDNLSLHRAIGSETELSFVYCLDPKDLTPHNFYSKSLGEFRLRFLSETLLDLQAQLRTFGQHINVVYAPPIDTLDRLTKRHNITRIYRSNNADWNERALFKRFKESHPKVDVICSQTSTLFETADLPFEPEDLPKTFTLFRKRMETLPVLIRQPLPYPTHLPNHVLDIEWPQSLFDKHRRKGSLFRGGSAEASKHMKAYFSGDLPQTYKETRNNLDTWEDSTKLSAWLANGCISPRQVWYSILDHEHDKGENESTYWIKFELLWREYFQWYAYAYGSQLFRFDGINGKKPMTSFYSERFKRWTSGNTSFPIVNACMKQLNETGYMSNRGRQLAASCLIHELQVDWRYGAAYFEQQLIDYDVASNWGNWQYLAGVGADPRGSRRFNLQKQTETYDPNGEFIARWKGESGATSNDSVDAADWPIMPTDTPKGAQ
jgi:deoxyribodipyrimidine photo-lyase